MIESPGAVAFAKGHGTGNDFVLLPDPNAALELTPALVRALCDRRFGIGADGVLRVVPAAAVPESVGGSAVWFMDYHNADGSLAEMCGNGARLFARYLVDTGAERVGDFLIATRGGVRSVRVPRTGPVTVGMGPAVGGEHPVQVDLDGRSWPASAVYVPNPHAVVVVPATHELGDIRGATVTPRSAFPDGVNVEFVEQRGPDHIAMRVLERGAGETLSCGTGACAAAWVHRQNAGGTGPVTVTVPGGELTVEQAGEDLTLTGPAEFVAAGHLDLGWWERAA